MKKEIVQYATGKFKHFDGQEREFTVCMASISPTAYEFDRYETPINVTNIKGEKIDVVTEWKRYVCFGISVRNPQDIYSKDIAKKIAYGRAFSYKGYTVAFDSLVLMSSDVANALLDNFVSRVSNDPSLAIINYDEQEKAYLKKCRK